MKRLVIFAHFDAQNEVKRYVEFLLAELRRACDRIVFVSTSPLPPAELAKLEPTCAETLMKDNAGFDFGMWQHALARTDLAAWDEVVLVNSSIFGPLAPLAPILERMSRAECDFWGMTESEEIAPHLQSYFLVFKRAAVAAPAFRAFWDSVLPYRDKRQVIYSYEVGMTRFLSENGLRRAAFVHVGDLDPPRWSRRRYWRECNPTCFYPTLVLAAGMPFVKIELLRDNPASVPLTPVFRAMEQAGFDLDLIEFDRPRQRRWSPRVLFTDRAVALYGHPRATQR